MTAGENFSARASAFLYGMTGFEFERQLVEMRSSREMLFMTLLYGEILGVPLIPHYYSLALLPYVVPDIATWKRHALREKDVLEREELDLHGL
jgi:hypothetical protein